MAGLLPILGAVAQLALPVPPQTGTAVYFAQGLEEPMQLSIDDGPLETAPAMSRKTFSMEPGVHRFGVVLADGETFAVEPDLKEADAVQVGARRYWCLMMTPAAGDDEAGVRLLPPARCEAFIKLGRN